MEYEGARELARRHGTQRKIQVLLINTEGIPLRMNSAVLSGRAVFCAEEYKIHAKEDEDISSVLVYGKRTKNSVCWVF
jgi:hypothetical protein